VKYAQFSAVGISNMLVDVGVLNFLPLLGPTRSPELLVLYNVAALVPANANSYLWNTFWTFKDQARHDAKQVGLFTAQGLFNVALGSALLWLAAHGLMAYTPLPLAQRQRGQGHLHGVRLDGQLPLFAPVRLQAKEA
jgi:putative flippase GtrA